MIENIALQSDTKNADNLEFRANSVRLSLFQNTKIDELSTENGNESETSISECIDEESKRCHFVVQVERDFMGRSTFLKECFTKCMRNVRWIRCQNTVNVGKKSLFIRGTLVKRKRQRYIYVTLRTLAFSLNLDRWFRDLTLVLVTQVLFKNIWATILC